MAPSDLPEDEDLDPVGPMHDPLGAFRKDAEAVGLIRPGDPLDKNLVDFAFRLVERCASIGDGYSLDDGESNAGEHIRAILGEP